VELWIFLAGRKVLDVAFFSSHTWHSGGGSTAKRRRRRADPTVHWEQLELLCAWDEQREYERIRPLVLFGEPIPERAVQTGTSERTLYRRIAGLEEHGMRSLFGSDPAKRRVLPAWLRRLIVDLKAEHPMLNFNEIARICYVRTGRKRHLATVRGVLDEEPVPIKALRRFEPYHEIPEGRERRKAVVALHYEGWADKSIAHYLKIDRSTVRRVLKRWEQEGPEGLEDRMRPPEGRAEGGSEGDGRGPEEAGEPRTRGVPHAGRPGAGGHTSEHQDGGQDLGRQPGSRGTPEAEEEPAHQAGDAF
jgi:hypothetical protein